MEPLTPEEIEAALKTSPDWKLHQGRLVSQRIFPDFVAAIAFVNHIAGIAEAAGHHPDIDIRYNRVTLGLVTHDANGITERDLTMASQISSELAADQS